MSWKKRFPTSEGWTHATFTMRTTKPWSEEAIKKLATVGNPDAYEFGRVEQYGKSIRVIYRLLNKVQRRCRVCGCTEDDCSQCIEKTGEPCHWVDADLCSACVPATGTSGGIAA